MPELPEMENYKIMLNQRLNGRVVSGVEINREKSINVDIHDFINIVQGQKIVSVQRRAKHLIFILQNGQVLLLHLMLGGWMFLGREEDKPKRTIQVKLSFNNEHLYFIGLRLGYLHVYSNAEVEKELSDLGPEPLDSQFTLLEFQKLMNGKKGRLKTKLVDQHFISGIGNCYSDEICFHAGIIPKRDLQDLKEEEKNQLYASMQFVLRDATRHGGYMENPFFKGDTLTGGYNDLCKVYDCEGKECQRCGTNIVKEILSSRKTFYCPNCQI
jgi:formamidopyrimidine-DNA glycosylase